MKQILQSLKTGTTEVAEVPCPAVRSGQLLIRSSRTLVSVGTERMLVEFGKAGWIAKARQQPDKVRVSATSHGNRVTGNEVGRSEKVTGDEPGTCKNIKQKFDGK